MNRFVTMLAATGRGPRILFGLACVAATAAHAWPVAIEPAPERRPATVTPPSGQAVMSRPLFDPGRRDWTARGSRAAVLEGDPPRPILTLRGIRGDGGSARVLIDDGSGDRTWLRSGEGRNGWQVGAIGADRVTLVQDGRSYTTEFMGPPAILRPQRRILSEAEPRLRP